MEKGQTPTFSRTELVSLEELDLKSIHSPATFLVWG